MNSIYLDNNATTALDPKVLEAMVEIYSKPLNPSSIHHLGKEGKNLLSKAREQIGEFLGVLPETIIFTSSGTESMNLLIKGLYKGDGTILSTEIEHSCVYETIVDMEKKHTPVRFIKVDSKGAPELSEIESSIDASVTLMVFSAVYSETGAILDIKGLAHLAKKHQIPLILDGVALLGKESFTIDDGITAIGFSSHKFHGPKGVGLFYLAPKTKCQKLMFGGHQEKDLRPGTENLEGIIGCAKAISLLKGRQGEISDYLKNLRDLFESLLKKDLPNVHINGEAARVSNTSNLYFDGIDNETLLLALDRKGICVSAGSACSSGAIEPSRILLKMGYERKRAKSSLRFSFSRFNTEQQIIEAASAIVEIVKKLKG